MKSNRAIGIYGASGFGKEVLPLLRESKAITDDIYFIDDFADFDKMSGLPVISFDRFLELPQGEKSVSVAVADAFVRRKLCERIESSGCDLLTVIADNSVVMDDVTIGDGSILSAFVTLTSDIKIGKAFHANIYSYVAHECVIGDYVTFAPCVKCNGNVVIEDGAYIGTGAILRQGDHERPLVIGRGSVVGMGAVVTKDVPADVTVVGIPARIQKSKSV